MAKKIVVPLKKQLQEQRKSAALFMQRFMPSGIKKAIKKA